MLTRQDWLLLTLSRSPGGAMSPVQIQKALFLFGQEVGGAVGTQYYSFVPYDYGPFDSAIYVDLRRMMNKGHVGEEWSPGRSWKELHAYRPRPEGRARARKRSGRPACRVPRTNRGLGQGAVVLGLAPQRLRRVPGIRSQQRVPHQMTVLVGILASDGRGGCRRSTGDGRPRRTPDAEDFTHRR